VKNRCLNVAGLIDWKRCIGGGVVGVGIVGALVVRRRCADGDKTVHCGIAAALYPTFV
jgi:hypothetical protein